MYQVGFTDDTNHLAVAIHDGNGANAFLDEKFSDVSDRRVLANGNNRCDHDITRFHGQLLQSRVTRVRNARKIVQPAAAPSIIPATAHFSRLETEAHPRFLGSCGAVRLGCAWEGLPMRCWRRASPSSNASIRTQGSSSPSTLPLT